MRIVHVCPRYHPDIGGVETVVKELSEGMVKLGYEVAVITTDPTGKLPKYEIVNGASVIRFESFAPGNAYFINYDIKRYINGLECDVIHAHSYHAFPALFAALAKKNKAKFIFSPYYHGKGHTWFRDLLHTPYRLLGESIFKRADTVICVSEYEKKLAERDFKCKNIQVLPCGVNIQKGDFEKVPKTLLYVGRLEKYKGIQHVIRALPYLSEYRFFVVGNGSYKQELVKLKNSLDIDSRLQFIDWVTDENLRRMYCAVDIFITMSENESFGISVAEALKCGTPCVVKKGTALDEFIDGIGCIGVNNPINPMEIVNAIKAAKGPVNLDKILTWDQILIKYEVLL